MSFWRRRELKNLAFVLPFVIVFTAFVLVPLVQTVVLSFSGADPLWNYRTLFGIPKFRRALLHTLGYTVLAALLVTVFSFPTACLVQRHMRRHPRIRHMMSLPYITSMMSIGLLNLMFFNTQNSLLNKLLPLFGLQPQNWLEDPGAAFVCVLLLMSWYGYTYTTFACLQAMNDLPDEPYEAATIAGATRWQAFRYITFPQVLPTLGYVIPTTVIATLTMFEPILTMYYAGMDTSVTGSVAYMFYQQAFSGKNPGLACAMAVTLIVPILLCCFCYARYILNDKTAR